MEIAIFYWLLGLLLIFVEFYLPGGIFALMGGLSFVIGWFTGVQCISHPLKIAAWTFCYLLSLYLMIKFSIWKIKKSGEGMLVSSASQAGYSANIVDKTHLGSLAIASCDLRPSGWIDIQDQRLPAISNHGYIVKGTPVIVVALTGADLIVHPQTVDSPNPITTSHLE